MNKPLKLSWAQACCRSLKAPLVCFIAAIGCLALPSVGSAVQVMPQPGFNLGNTLEATWGYTPPTQALINSIADAGFKTLRVPCAWYYFTTNGTTIDASVTNFTINAAFMAEVKNVVDWALAKGMYVTINDHWDNGWFDDPFNTYSSTLNSKLTNIWIQVANQFKNYDSTKLSFSCANEPTAASPAQVTVLYQYYQNWINAMRATGGNNATRWLVVQASCPWNWDILLNNGTNLPTDSAKKLMIEEHTYDPGEFTTTDSDQSRHMLYFWGSAYHVTGSLTNRNCTSMEESYLESQFAKLKAAFVDKGYPVLIGEWAAQPKPTSVTDLTGQYRDQNFRSTTYYCKFMENLIQSYGFSGTFFTGQGDMFDVTTGTINNQDKLNGVLGISYLSPVASLLNVADGTYRIIARHSGKAMDANGAGTANGTQIIQWTYGGGNNQRWTVTNRGNNQYSIIGVQSGKAVDVNNWGTANGTKVQLWDYAGGTNQKYTFTATSGGYYEISPIFATGSCLDVNGASTADGALVQLWGYSGSNNQQWMFQAP